MKLPAHLQDLVDSDTPFEIVADNCRGHRRPVNINNIEDPSREPFSSIPQRRRPLQLEANSWDLSPSSRWDSCKKADKAPIMKSRRQQDDGPTALFAMMKSVRAAQSLPQNHSLNPTLPGVPQPHDSSESTALYISNILGQLDLLEDLWAFQTISITFSEQETLSVSLFGHLLIPAFSAFKTFNFYH